MRVMQLAGSLMLGVVLMACGKTSAPASAAPGQAAPAEAAPAEAAIAGGAALSCEAVVAHELEVVAATGDLAMKEDAAKNSVEKAVESCQRDAWSEDVRRCVIAATTADRLYHDCYVRPLAGKELVIGRVFASDDPSVLAAADPKAMTVSGDFFQVREGCGILVQKQSPSIGAVFLVCDGQTSAPLVTSTEIKQAFDVFAAEQASGHDLVMGIMANYPSGRFGGNWRVCQGSNCHIE